MLKEVCVTLCLKSSYIYTDRKFLSCVVLIFSTRVGKGALDHVCTRKENIFLRSSPNLTLESLIAEFMTCPEYLMDNLKLASDTDIRFRLVKIY